MDKKFICYCGLYCENCAVKSKIEPSGKKLYDEMTKAGFEEIVPLIPGGKEFWSFLKPIAGGTFCVSCRDGSGNPECEVRKCAREKSVDLCALCESYPCEKISVFFKYYSMLEEDNELIRREGMEAWAARQDKRKVENYAYSDNK